MTSGDRPVSWAHSAAGAIVINGVIAAVVGALTSWVLNNASTVPWERIAWASVGVAMGAFLLLSVIVKRLRDMIWRRPARWIWSRRPVSYRRHCRELAEHRDAMLAEASDLSTAISKNEMATDKISEWAHQAIENVRLSIPDVTQELLKQIQENRAAIEQLHADGNHLGERKSQGLAVDVEANKIAASASLRPAPPLPRPRWHAGPDNVLNVDQYVIQNMVPRSVAREVRVEAVEDMEIIDAGHWEDLSTTGPTGGTGTF